MSGSPAAARNVGSQSWCWTISLETAARLDLAGPADHLGNPERALPVGGLLAAERGGRAVGPAVGVRAVVGAVDDDGVLGDAEFVDQIEQLADVAVVVDHRVVVRRLPAAGLAEALRLGVRPEVHVGHVHPDEERGAGLVLAPDEIDARAGGLVVDGLHPLLGQRPGVLDALLADWAVAVVDLAAVLVGGPGVDDAARQQRLAQQRRFLLGGIVRVLGFLLGVEVVQVAEELVEPVRGRQVLVQVAEVVLAELAGRVPQWLEQLGDGRILLLQADVHAGHPDLAHAGAVHALPGDERRPARRAALLAVGIGEKHSLVGDPVDVGREVAHHSAAVATQVRDADVVAPDDEDVRFLVRHGSSPSLGIRAVSPLLGRC